MPDLTIGELEESTGVPRRTIYFYVQQGILPPPAGAGLAARYGTSHLDRLRALPRLRARGWRLDRIRDFFARAGTDAICAVAGGGEPVPARTPPDPERPTVPYPRPHLAIAAHYALAPGVDLYVDQRAAPEVRQQVERWLARLGWGSDGTGDLPESGPSPASGRASADAAPADTPAHSRGSGADESTR